MAARPQARDGAADLAGVATAGAQLDRRALLADARGGGLACDRYRQRQPGWMLAEDRGDLPLARDVEHERGDGIGGIGAAGLAVLTAHEELVRGQLETAIEDRTPRDQERAQHLPQAGDGTGRCFIIARPRTVQVMARSEQPNSEKDPQGAGPGDPETNTRPRGNGDYEEHDAERGKEKLDSVLGH